MLIVHLLVTIFFVFGVTRSVDAAPVAFDVLTLAGKTPSEVEAAVGRASGCSQAELGLSCRYEQRGIQIVFISDKADWITFERLPSVKFAASAIQSLGLPLNRPDFQSADVIRWTGVGGLREVAIFPADDNVWYVHVKVLTP